MPKKRCACMNHAFYAAQNLEAPLLSIDGRKVKQSTLRSLRERGDLAQHSTFICSSCVKHAEDNFMEQEPPSKKPKIEIDQLINIITSLEEGELNTILFTLGTMARKGILKDIDAIGSSYKNVEFLSTVDVTEWISKRSQMVTKFLDGISGTDRSMKTAICVEQMYHCATKNFVGPFGFNTNLMVYHATGSRSGCDIISAATPAGSYTTLCNTLTDMTKNRIVCNPTGDVVTFFDNNQILEKKWHVETSYKSKCSVTTNVIHFYHPSSIIQNDVMLSPEHWLRTDSGSITDLSKELEKKRIETNSIFRDHRYEFIKKRIDHVSKTQKKNGNTYTDHIDKEDFTISSNNDRYDLVPEKHPADKITSVVGEPVFVNPCSYSAVQLVFDQLSQELGLQNNRSWSILGSDGSPYTLGSRLKEDVFLCPDCQWEGDGLSDFMLHRTEQDHTEVEVEKCKKYKKLLLLPGLGHYEINMLKLLYQLFWPVCLKSLARLLGYESPKAQAACESASDHHKSWQIFQMFLFAMSDELLLPYVRHCLMTSLPATVEGFYSFVNNTVDNPNYVFMADVVFSSSFALHLFRAGVRRNNSSAIQCAKNKFASLFFGMNKPNYMETYIRDSFVRLQCPASVRAFIEDNESYSSSGHPNKGQGGDFVLEEANRRVKMFIPPGLPDDKKWLRSCRNVDRLQKIKEQFDQLLHRTSADPDYENIHDISKEINHFRSFTRTHSFLSKHNILTSINGEILNENLVNFINLSEQNFHNHLQTLSKSGIRKKQNHPHIPILISSTSTPSTSSTSTPSTSSTSTPSTSSTSSPSTSSTSTPSTSSTSTPSTSSTSTPSTSTPSTSSSSTPSTSSTSTPSTSSSSLTKKELVELGQSKINDKDPATINAWKKVKYKKKEDILSFIKSLD